MLDKLQKQVCSTVGPMLAVSFESVAYHQIMISVSVFYKFYFNEFSSEYGELVAIPFSLGRSTFYCNRLHNLSVTVLRRYEDVYVNSFLSCTARFWNFFT